MINVEKSAINGNIADKSVINRLSPKNITDIGDKNGIVDKKSAINQKVKESIIAFLKKHPEGKTTEIAEHIGLKASRTRDYMKELISDGTIEALGSNRNRTYRLKIMKE